MCTVSCTQYSADAICFKVCVLAYPFADKTASDMPRRAPPSAPASASSDTGKLCFLEMISYIRASEYFCKCKRIFIVLCLLLAPPALTTARLRSRPEAAAHPSHGSGNRKPRKRCAAAGMPMMKDTHTPPHSLASAGAKTRLMPALQQRRGHALTFECLHRHGF